MPLDAPICHLYCDIIIISNPLSPNGARAWPLTHCVSSRYHIRVPELVTRDLWGESKRLWNLISFGLTKSLGLNADSHLFCQAFCRMIGKEAQ